MPKQIHASQLPPRAIMAVSGTVAFSRVAQLVDGQALQADIQRRTAAKRPVIDKPYTEITLNNVVIPCADPAHPTVQEQYLGERCYMSQSQRTPGLSFTATSKSPYLPWVGVRQGNQVVQITPEGELATGLKVTVVLQQFQPKNPSMQAGVSLIGVICEEEPRYRAAAAVTDLSSLGLTFKPLPSDGADQGADAMAGMPAAPMAPAAPVAAAPMAPAAAAPVQAAAPAAPNPFAPAAPVAPNPFAPAQAGAPVYSAPAGDGGIRFNPEEDGGAF